MKLNFVTEVETEIEIEAWCGREMGTGVKLETKFEPEIVRPNLSENWS